MALTSKVYLWTERSGVHYPPFPPARAANFVTCLTFSSDGGGKAILAISRHSGRVALWSLFESDVRFNLDHYNPVSCLAFKPVTTLRQSATSADFTTCEDLLVADDAGIILYYSVEWPEAGSIQAGAMILLARLQAHSQNICGLAWSPTGDHIATGGNDNSALLFDTAAVLTLAAEMQRGRPRTRSNRLSEPANSYTNPASIEEVLDTAALPIASISPRPRTPQYRLRPHNATPAVGSLPTPPSSPPRRPLVNTIISPGMPLLTNLHKYTFFHSAAVKALAFAPWQPTLLASGGGSNDRQIHFHHTGSGATLAIINVFAQVTSLVWSKTRREIAATFGYAQPEHEIRIAVFAWPSCDCVVSIPWDRKSRPGGGPGEVGRALWAVAYPGGPNDGITSASEDAEARRRRRRRQRRIARTQEDNDPDEDGATTDPDPALQTSGRFRVWDAEAAIEEYAPRRDSADVQDILN